ncbi:MAG: hypothetical protein ACD_23C00017G0002 [uncultured bacterium]|nr:MAG: hypothetical protein ACD_23C00017G0002 [uncultured bacterium]
MKPAMSLDLLANGCGQMRVGVRTPKHLAEELTPHFLGFKTKQTREAVVDIDHALLAVGHRDGDVAGVERPTKCRICQCRRVLCSVCR